MSKAWKVTGIIIGALAVIFVISIIFNYSKGTLPSGGISTGSSEALSGFPNPRAAAPAPLATNSVTLDKNASSSGSDETTLSQDLPITDKKIVKNGDLNLKVENVDQAAEKISDIAKNFGGEVFSSNFYQSSSNIKSGTITVKVPASDFENAFSEIKKVASLVLHESTSGQDVTEEYVDLQAQLKNLQAEEQSFVKILDQAQKIEDVLAVTRELATVRGNIEQMQVRIKYLESQTDMSTISASITEDANITIIDSWRPWQLVKESFNSLIKSLQKFVDFLIRFVIIILPMLLIWALFIWIIYKVVRKIYLKIKNKPQA